MSLFSKRTAWKRGNGSVSRGWGSVGGSKTRLPFSSFTLFHPQRQTWGTLWPQTFAVTLPSMENALPTGSHMAHSQTASDQVSPLGDIPNVPWLPNVRWHSHLSSLLSFLSVACVTICHHTYVGIYLVRVSLCCWLPQDSALSFLSQQHPQHLQQCLVHRRRPVSICWMNTWVYKRMSDPGRWFSADVLDKR